MKSLIFLTFIFLINNAAAENPVFRANIDRFTTIESLEHAGRFNTLLSLLKKTGLDKVIENSEEDIGLIAPTDDAFEKIPRDTLETILNDEELLTRILKQHVTLAPDRGTLFVGNYVSLDNTKINVGVRKPGELNNSNFPGFVNNIPVTKSFFLSFADGRLTQTARLTTSQGSILALSEVLPFEDSSSLSDLIALPKFSVLKGLIERSGLDLAQFEQLTVFAPNNAAFSKLPQGLIDSLFADNELLKNVLLFHVLEVSSTLSGLLRDIRFPSGTVTLRGTDILIKGQAAVLTGDIVTTEGFYVNEIDTVLIPSDLQ